ncbi:hypothetical protein ACFFHH_02020 [Cytobacillus solani]|uniref:Yip1 domain-containing protein n=1 Tax=Cytobacillus solani TaxID=1637975 RepID=A0A0Q3QT94_9BACI|nr:hypothetical protein [Cytobacillus solani]KOP71969.1 hypothetical protein AMS60_22125 [Bacillus sp. FJAT-21945]KQL21369.1 hypothetical protein AN957_24285 [Cytobacillus solani]USK54659.1 hypothetical protein LIS82_24475 [Cytobacillus solani]
MVYYVQLIKGLLHPSNFSYQMEKAEEIRGLWKKVVFLILSSILISAIAGYYGVGLDILAKEITGIPQQELEAKKVIAGIGKVIWGAGFAAFVLFGWSIILWALMDLPYKKLVVIQLFVLIILLLEKAVLLPFNVSLGISSEFSPFGLGVMARYITSNMIVVYLLSHISIFKIWVIIFQYVCIKRMSEKNPKVIFILIVCVNLFFWLISTLLSYLKIESLI